MQARNRIGQIGMWIAVLGVLAVGVPAVSQAQTVVNPTTIEWDPSADHAVLGLDGQPLVASYRVDIYLESNQTTPALTFDAGKPAPVSGKIAIINPAWFAVPIANVRYVAKVAAVGPTGVGVSTPSNPFGATGPPAAPGAPTVRQSPSGGGGSSTGLGSVWFGSAGWL
jgi:hypothetical protein